MLFLTQPLARLRDSVSSLILGTFDKAVTKIQFSNVRSSRFSASKFSGKMMRKKRSHSCSDIAFNLDETIYFSKVSIFIYFFDIPNTSTTPR